MSSTSMTSTRLVRLTGVLVLGLTAVLTLGTHAGSAALYKATSCPSTPHVNGFDVNHVNGTITWASVRCEQFVYAQATDGTSYVDANFSAIQAGARAVGVPFGAVDFFEPGIDPAAQANHFLHVASPRPGDLVPALDLEVANGQSAATILSEVSTWVSTVKAATGVAPAIYTFPAFWSGTLGDPSTFTTSPLWIANWGVTSPTVPASDWGGHGWTLWQYSGTGTVPGVQSGPNTTGLDYFAGPNMTSLLVSQATSATGLRLSTTHLKVGHEQLEHLSVIVSGQFAGMGATGTVVVKTTSSTVCKLKLKSNKGSCTLKAAQLAAGKYVLVASFSGSTILKKSVSAKKTITVVK